MRVLMLAQFYPPDIGGEERHVRNLSVALADRGHEVVVVTTALPATGAGRRREDGVEVVRVGSTAQRLPLHGDPDRPHATPFPDLEMRRAVAAELAAGRFDVAHAHNWIVNSAIGPARRQGVPLVLTLHDYAHVCAVKRFVHDGRPCSGPSPAKCVRCAARHYGSAVGPATVVANAAMSLARNRGIARYLAVSSAVADGNRLAASGVPYEVVPNFVPDDLVEPDPVPIDGPLLFTGDLTTQKGVLVLAEAYRRLAGPPELRLVGRSIPGVEVPTLPGLRLVGPLPHEQVMPEVTAARLVVVPSVMPDPCPTVVLEAMAKGRPVVAAGHGGIVDMVDDGVTGRLVPPGDPAALAAAIAELLAAPDRAAAMGAAGRQKVRGFTASSVVARVERVYRDLASNRPAPAHPDQLRPGQLHGGRLHPGRLHRGSSTGTMAGAGRSRP